MMFADPNKDRPKSVKWNLMATGQANLLTWQPGKREVHAPRVTRNGIAELTNRSNQISQRTHMKRSVNATSQPELLEPKP